MFTQDLSYPQGFGGDPGLLSALASFNAYFRPAIQPQPSHIVLTAGASSCPDQLLYTICDAGDSVLVPAPYWSMCLTRSSFILIGIGVRVLQLLILLSMFNSDPFFNSWHSRVFLARTNQCPVVLLDGFDFHLTLRTDVTVVPVSSPFFSSTISASILPALNTAYDIAPDPARVKALILQPLTTRSDNTIPRT